MPDISIFTNENDSQHTRTEPQQQIQDHKDGEEAIV
jgi:hypothetical protein